MKIVIALGGNALGKTPEEQLELVKETAKQIVKIVKAGHEVVVVHGNGPQVGMINLAFDNSYQNKAGTPLMPFAECGAMSQGYIGYHLQQTITDELNAKKIDKECVTIITQVQVDPKDPAFENPTKPVGMFYTKAQADKIAKEKGYTFVEDAGRGYRRVVPSPKPVNIVEQDVIREMVKENDSRTVMRLHPFLAPYKACILPLSKQLKEGALKIYADLAKYFMIEYDEAGSIGKRYRRQDAIGTPFCITYDFESEEDGAVTVRDRDTMQQERININDLVAYLTSKVEK